MHLTPQHVLLAGATGLTGEHLLDRTTLYEGVAETLAKLPQRKIILSNKPEALSKKAVEGLGVARFFDAVYGGDSFPIRKPDGEVLRRAAAGSKRPLMIGDSGVDVQTARNAGVPGVRGPGRTTGVFHGWTIR